MPIYEYQCRKCGHQLEAIQKVSDAALTDCPACGAHELKKKVSAAAFRLKGGGWYETDFKSGQGKKNLHGEAGKTATGDKGGSAGADSAKTSTPAGGTSGGGGEKSA